MDLAEILSDSAHGPSFGGLFDHVVFVKNLLLTYFMLIQVVYSSSYMHSRKIQEELRVKRKLMVMMVFSIRRYTL